MATDHAAPPVNGNYAPPGDHSSSTADQQAHSNINESGAAPGTFGSQNANVPSSATAGAGNSGHTEVSKDEVGWYFVEQYYTNLSRSPDKLHLFYTKRSQFVSGVEAEKVPVSVGRTAISERIKELGFQDCKVRVSNVDSQASFNNIVIQVIGEMSNKSAPHRKFVQTFVLAEQPNGYYVLNDIFRYINEDEEEDEANVEPYREEDAVPAGERQEESQTQTQSQDEVKALTSSDDPQQQQRDAEKVDERLEVIAKDEPSLENNVDDRPEHAMTADHAKPEDASEAAGTQPTEEVSVPSDAADEDAAATPAPGADADAVPEEEAPEKPRDPEPTPAISQPATPDPPSQSPNAAPQKPAPPKTWANLVAASKSAAPTAPTAPTAPSPANSTQPRSAPPAAPPTESSESTTPPPHQQQQQQQQQQQNAYAGWQTAGNDHARRQARPQSISGPGDRDKVLAYVKNVTDKVPTEALRSALLKFGELAYFDVSRQKNCAFVEFSTAAGYNAAVAANPHQIAGEMIYVEERRPRSGAYGGAGYNANRGGPGRGRGGPDGRGGYQGRGGYMKDGGRGNFGPSRGRGGNMPMRGRGGVQTP